MEILHNRYASAVIDETVVAQAASNGHVEILQWIQPRLAGLLPCYRDYSFYTMNSMALAAENGHLAVVQWLFESRGMDNEDVQRETSVARGGHSKVFKWLRTYSTKVIESRVLKKAAGEFSEIVEFMHADWSKAKLESNRSSSCASTRAMNQAACNGHLEMVKWLHEDRK